jgi:ATP-binding cassette subfamily B protein
VGENGGGKSTLTKLMLRLYDVDSGQVLINGRNIREYDIHACGGTSALPIRMYASCNEPAG